VSTLYWVQTASLTSRLNAEAARDTLTSKHMKAEIFTKETATGLTHRVRVGPFKNKTEAEYWLKKIKEIKGFEGSYVTQDRKKS
ncbi:SPOR domain-containing protein, partial [Pectobacterium brasiliense]|nr:SPOR domain-containing protein [Pectobacterium brasiliense]